MSELTRERILEIKELNQFSDEVQYVQGKGTSGFIVELCDTLLAAWDQRNQLASDYETVTQELRHTRDDRDRLLAEKAEEVEKLEELDTMRYNAITEHQKEIERLIDAVNNLKRLLAENEKR